MRKVILFFVMMWLIFMAGCSGPKFDAIPKEKDVLITVNIKDGSLTFFDLRKEKVLTKWHIQKPYKGAVLFPDGDSLMLYGSELNTVDLYSLGKGKKIGEWKTGKGIVNALVSNDKKHIFLADQNKNSIRIFQMNGKQIGKVEVGKKPLDLLQGTSGTMLYVINFNDDKLSVVDVIKQKAVRSIAIPRSSTGGLIRENKKEIWIGGHGSGSHVQSNIHVYSLETGKLLQTISATEMPISFVETKHGIFALSHGTNTVRKFHESKEEAAEQVGANPFSMTAVDNKLYIASYDSDEVYVMDQQSLKVWDKFKCGKGPFQILVRRGDSVGQKNRADR